MKICLKSCLLLFVLTLSFSGLQAQSKKCNPAACKKSAKKCSSSFSSIANLFNLNSTETTETIADAITACCAKAFAGNPNCTPEECAKICADNPDCDPAECSKAFTAYQNASPEVRAKLVATSVATANTYGSEVSTDAPAKKNCNPANCAKSCKKGKLGAKKAKTSSL